MRIGLHFVFQLDLQNKQVKLNFIQSPLSLTNSNMTQTVFVLSVHILLLKRQTNWFLEIQLQQLSLPC